MILFVGNCAGNIQILVVKEKSLIVFMYRPISSLEKLSCDGVFSNFYLLLFTQKFSRSELRGMFVVLPFFSGLDLLQFLTYPPLCTRQLVAML